jgi:hypothetical protein
MSVEINVECIEKILMYYWMNITHDYYVLVNVNDDVPIIKDFILHTV